MRSSLILSVALLLAIASTSIVQARKSECTCGGLGSGINPCKCGEVVVKAAKVHKPIYHASPEAINEAAAAREMAQRLSMGTNYPAPAVGPYGGGMYGTSSASSSSSSSLSSVGFLEKMTGPADFRPLSRESTSNTGCGCGRKSSQTLETRDLLSQNTPVVPNFPPIGDLCYPTKQTNSRLDVTTKVTPAYPAKFRCTCSEPQELCLNVVNGQIDSEGMEKLSMLTSQGGSDAASRGIGINVNIGKAGSLGGYTSNLGSYSSSSSLAGSNFGGYTSSSSLAGSSYGLGSTGASSLSGYGYGSSAALGGVYGSSGNLGGSTMYNSLAGSYAGSSASSGLAQSGASAFGGYGMASGFDASRGNNIEFYQGIGGGSGCGDDYELPEDYSYPRLPADPVSLTLAYKTLFAPRTVIYNRKGGFVPEDKLAFGHRTVPTELAPTKTKPDVPEEKLQIVDKPVVELKAKPPMPITIGVYDEREEAKLAELEAIERERINQEEVVSQPQMNLITYGDLGYAPVQGLLPGGLVRPGPSFQTDMPNMPDVDDTIPDDGCGPVGPPAPGYVPGSIVIERELVETTDDAAEQRQRNNLGMYGRRFLEEVESSDEEYDSDDSTSSGIFARLRSAARSYGPGSCLH